MSCTDVQTIQAGNGTKTQFSFDFPYIFKSEIHVYFWNATTKEWDEKLTTDGTYPWRVTDANPTIVEFTDTAPPSPATPTDPGEVAVDNVRIRRITNIDDIRALFNPGSAIRSDDLNKNFEQLRYALQEANCPGVPEDVEQYLKDYYWDRFDNTIYDGNPWVSDDTKIATTEAIDDRVDAKIDTAITTDITGADGIDVRPNTSNGTTVIGIQEGGVDANRLLEDDIIIESEGLTEAQSGTFNDDRLVSAATAEHRYRNYVTQPGDSAPSVTNKLKGQVWFQNDSEKTVSIFNGTSWVAVGSGGDFTVQPTTIYVDRYSGNDDNNGRRIINQVRTIKRALELANDGDYISIAPGVYQEQLPLDITQKNLSIVGDSIRSVFVQPLSNCESKMQDPYQTMEAEQTDGGGTTNPDYWNVNQQNYVDAVMFRCNSGTYISNMTFVGMKADTTSTGQHPIDPYVAEEDENGNPNQNPNPTGLPRYQGWIFGFLPGALITKSPYIQNCTNFTDSQIDNSSEYNTNTVSYGTAGDLTSEFTGGGIIVDGAKPAFTSKLRSMVADSFTQVGLKGPGIFVTNNGYTQLTSSYSFFGHYHLKAHNGGQANLAASTTDFGDYALVADGKSPNAIFTAQVDSLGGYSAGAEKVRIDNISPFTLGSGNTGVPATNMVVQIGSDIYPIINWNSTNNEITIFRANTTNASLNDGLASSVLDDATISFYFRSMVASSGHTMEYAGSGTDYRALPENGGTPDEAKQITELNNGKIWAVIVDHQGKFKAGNFEIDQLSGTISLPTGGLGIPLLIEDLDTDTQNITSSDTNGIQITSKVDLNTNQIVGLDAPTNNTDAANKQYADSKVEEVATTAPITQSTTTANGVKTVTLDIDYATTSTAGVVELSLLTDSTSTTTVATSSAVKIAYDLADAALPKSGGVMTGNIDLDGSDLVDVGALNTTGNVTIGGDLTVNGTTTTVNSTTVTVDDKNIELGTVATPTDTTADGGGITLKGATDKTFSWIDSTDSWTSSEHIDLASGKEFKINGTSVLSGSTLGSGVTDSSLTSVGTIATGTWNGTEIGVDYGGTGQTSYADGELLIGNSTGNTLSKSTLTAGTNVTITNGNGSITIASTDTNTTYTAGDGLDLTNTEFSVDLAANGGLEISNTELQVDSTVVRTTGDNTFTGDLFLSETSGNILNTLAFKELASNGSNWVGFKAPNAIAANVTWTLPAADGTTTQTLSTDGNGILYWQTPTAVALKGGGGDQVFVENDQVVTTNYTITTNKNAMSAGPITVNQGVTVTVPSGSTWTVV